MPTDFTSTDADLARTDGEGSMFAPIPSWERGKSRRSFGGRGTRVAPEARSFAPNDTTVESAPFVDTETSDFAATPVFASRTTVRKGNGAAPIAIAAGVILLGGLAAAGWYATQPHDQGVAELTPGSSVTTTSTSAPAAGPATPDAALPGQMAQNTTQASAAPAAATHARIITTTQTRGPMTQHNTTTVARAASAKTSRTVSDNAADASTIAPAPAPATVAPPTPPAPAVIPAMPQTTQAPPPTQTPPTV
jgi:hypothetical protein